MIYCRNYRKDPGLSQAWVSGNLRVFGFSVSGIAGSPGVLIRWQNSDRQVLPVH